VIPKICLHLIYHTELQNFLIAPRMCYKHATTNNQTKKKVLKNTTEQD